MIGAPAWARELEADNDQTIRAELSGLPLASFEDALRDFRKAKEDFLSLESKKIPAASASPAPAERPLEIQGFMRFEAPTIIKPQVLPAPEPERIKLLEKMTEVLIERNHALEKKISSQDIYQTQEKNILPKVAEDLEKLKQLKAEVARVKTESEIEAAAEKIKAARAPQKQLEIKKSIVLPHLLKFENQALRAAEMRKEKILEKIGMLEAAGKDVAALKDLLDKASAKIEAVKTKIGKAKTEVQKPNLKTDLETIQNQLKDVYKIFRDIAILGKSL